MRVWHTDGARSALRLALELALAGAEAGSGGNEVLLPAYLCDTLIAPFRHRGLTVRYYDVCPDLTVDLQDLTRRLGPRTRALLFIHYFGFLQPEPVLAWFRALREGDGGGDGGGESGRSGTAPAGRPVIIEDQTHAVWTLAAAQAGREAQAGRAAPVAQPAGPPAPAPPLAGDYAIASYRKFGASFDGGYLAVDERARLPRRVGDDQPQSRLHDWASPAHCLSALAWGLAGRPDFQDTARRLWEEAEVQYDRDRVPRVMSPGTGRLLTRLDVPALVNRRRRAYREALDTVAGCALGAPLWPELPEGVCPLTLPVMANSAADRGPLRAWLARHGLQSVLLWPLAPGVDPAAYPGAAAAAARLVQVLLPLSPEENRAL